MDTWNAVTARIAACVIERPDLLGRAEDADLAPGPHRDVIRTIRRRVESGLAVDRASMLEANDVSRDVVIEILASDYMLSSFPGYVTEARHLAARNALARGAKDASPNDLARHVERLRASGSTAGRPVELSGADIKTRPIRWLWRWRLAAGKLSILDGDPDVGKSLTLVDLAARVTTDRPMPDGSPGLGEPRDVVVISAFEDALDDTWVPRFCAAGGDRPRVTFLRGVTGADGKPRPLAFPGDTPVLIDAIRRHDAALVVSDAVMHLIPDGVSPFSTKEVQRYLHPIAEQLAETDAALIAARHYSKGAGRSALEKGQGSASLIGVARVGLGMVRDPDQPEGGRLLGFSKGNIVPDAERESLRLRIRQVDRLEIDGIEHHAVPAIEWQGVDRRSVDDVLAAAAEGEPGERADAREAILASLADGPLSARDLERRVSDLGVGRHRFQSTRSTLRREGLIDRRQAGEIGQRGGGVVEWFLADREGAEWVPHPSGEAAGEPNAGGPIGPASHAGSRPGDGLGPSGMDGRGTQPPNPLPDEEFDTPGTVAGMLLEVRAEFPDLPLDTIVQEVLPTVPEETIHTALLEIGREGVR